MAEMGICYVPVFDNEILWSHSDNQNLHLWLFPLQFSRCYKDHTHTENETKCECGLTIVKLHVHTFEVLCDNIKCFVSVALLHPFGYVYDQNCYKQKTKAIK